MKKILFITSSSINGGAQKHIRDMFIVFTKKGLDVSLVAPSGWLIDELSSFHEKIYRMQVNFNNIGKLRAIFDEIKPDITNTFILSGGFFGYLAWVKRKYGKIFITVNNPVVYDGISILKSYIYPRLYKWMAKGCSSFLTKSKTVGNEVAQIIGERNKVVAIKNGIDFSLYDKNRYYEDIKEELGLSSNAIIITNVAALDKRKGQSYLIAAARKLIYEFNNNLYFLIIGEGEEHSLLARQINDLGLSERVFILGKRKDINRILYYTDIFILPSLHEGLPNSLLEAMSMGVACIATNVGGVPELISDESLGIIIQPKSSDEIKVAVERLLSNGDMVHNLGQAAYEKMRKEYELGAVADELLEIYKTK